MQGLYLALGPGSARSWKRVLLDLGWVSPSCLLRRMVLTVSDGVDCVQKAVGPEPPAAADDKAGCAAAIFLLRIYRNPHKLVLV